MVGSIIALSFPEVKCTVNIKVLHVSPAAHKNFT